MKEQYSTTKHNDCVGPTVTVCQRFVKCQASMKLEEQCIGDSINDRNKMPPMYFFLILSNVNKTASSKNDCRLDYAQCLPHMLLKHGYRYDVELPQREV